MEIIGALSNPEVQGRIVRLARKLDQIDSGGSVPQTTAHRALRVGAVPEAIMLVLSASVEPVRMKDVHAEVEAQLGQPVSRSSVKNWLANHARVMMHGSCGWDEGVIG